MSDRDCANDCTMPLRFPRRPGTELPPGHGEGCPCCSAQLEHTSRDNRPALSRFNYRIGTYGSIREFLFHQIDKTPNLQTWTHRAPDDPAVALLEGASILGDILTFYQETYANEAFLGTAQWRESIADLVRLLGYRLSPAAGGHAVFAFELKKEEPVVIPAGFPLKATLEELPKPAEFETTAEITAYPWLGRFHLYKPLEDGDITPTTTEFSIAYPEQLLHPIDLRVGDRLIVGEAPAVYFPGAFSLTNAETIFIESIREEHGRTYYTIKGKLNRTSNIGSLSAYRVGRTFHHFGYNSPSQIVNKTAAVTSTATVSGSTTSTSSTIPYQTVPLARPVDTPFNAFQGATISASLSDNDFPIDSEVDDLPNNVPIVIQAAFTYPFMAYILGQPFPMSTLIRMITDVRTVTMTWGGISGTVSQLRLNDALDSSVGANATMQIADALFHEVTSPLFSLVRAKKETILTSGNRLYFYGTAEQTEILKDRRIMFEKPGEEPKIFTVTDIDSTSATGTEAIPQLHAVTLSESVSYADFPNDKPLVTVFGNLVDANEGKTLPETPIGSGDETAAFQNFKLPKAPLTYHLVPDNTPAETPELAIYVNGREWKRVDSFFGHHEDEQIYIVREDAEGNSWVQFGDGKSGARLTSGVNNVTAVFRTGSGAYGPLKADTKVQASVKLKNLDKVGMPMVATGGSASESGEHARRAAPGKVQSLGRIVSLKDFETEAAAIPGVASASASWQLVDHVPAVVVTVLMETGRGAEIAAVREILSAYNHQRGAARDPIDVVLGKRLYVTVAVRYALKPTYRADVVEPFVRRALGVNLGKAAREEDQTGLFSLGRRRFGGREDASSIEGAVQNVEGVLWARAVGFTALSDADDPTAIVPPALTILDPIVACDSNHILSLFDTHLTVTPVAEGGS
ncbi:MAG: hypothetical protein KF693_10420 [Nitrospira sp.]|nr:hypothetical protein [Nitrospira sp.]